MDLRVCVHVHKAAGKTDTGRRTKAQATHTTNKQTNKDEYTDQTTDKQATDKQHDTSE